MNKLTITNTNWNRQLEIYPGQEHYAIVRISRPGHDSLAIAINPEEAKQIIAELTNFIPSAAFTKHIDEVNKQNAQELKEIRELLDQYQPHLINNKVANVQSLLGRIRDLIFRLSWPKELHPLDAKLRPIQVRPEFHINYEDEDN